MKKLSSFLALILGTVPVAASADQVINMFGNYNYTGDLLIDGLTVGQCVQAGTGGKLQSSGAACGGGGGGVTSVTSTNSNLSASPTTGAVVLGFSSSPTFTGLTTTGTLQVNSSALISGVLTVNNSFQDAGTTDTNLTPNECVKTGSTSDLESTGAPCGAVASVTAGSSGNMSFSPTTGAVVGDIIENPTFTGTVTMANPTLPGVLDMGNPGHTADGLINISNDSGLGTQVTNIWSNSGQSVAGVTASCLAIDIGGTVTVLQAGDCAGNMGVMGHLAAGSLASSAGHCLQAATNGQIVATGAACAIPALMPMTSAAGNNTIPGGSGGVNTVTATTATSAYQNGPYLVPAGNIIHNLNVTCVAFNTTDAGAGNGPYNPLDSNGLGGYTANFSVVNGSNPSSSPLALGTVVLPTSPQAGPWVTSITSAMGSPYTVLAGDTVVVNITSPAATTQWDAECAPMYN